MSYDVLAVRAQREEATGAKPWQFHIGTDEFVLPPEPPAEMLPALAELAQFLDSGAQEAAEASPEAAIGIVTGLPALLAGLLGEADMARLAKYKLSIQDQVALLTTYVGERVGGSLGEPAPSPTSSPATPKTRKPTSKRTTGSRSSRTTGAR